jgi:hypothetical protein
MLAQETQKLPGIPAIGLKRLWRHSPLPAKMRKPAGEFVLDILGNHPRSIAPLP